MEKQLPKYAALVEWSKEQIQSGRFAADSRFHSEMDLAGRFDISRQTVRHALAQLEQEGYIRRVRGSGTFVAYNHQQRPRSGSIGVISTYLEDYIFTRIIRGVETVLSQAGYSMQLALTHNGVENEARALQNMLQSGVDGLIVEPTKSGLPSSNLDLYEQVRQMGIPLIFFNAYYPSLRIPYVALDDEAAGEMAAQCLIDAGHRRIVGFFQSDDLQGHLRYSGYTAAMKAAGLAVHGEDVLWYATEDRAGLIRDKARVLSRLTDCSGLVCYNDQLTLSILELFAESGIRVPEDISVVSIDNSDFASRCQIPFTSVCHPMDLLGETAARNLLSLMDGSMEPEAATVVFPPSLVKRSSVGIYVPK